MCGGGEAEEIPDLVAGALAARLFGKPLKHFSRLVRHFDYAELVETCLNEPGRRCGIFVCHYIVDHSPDTGLAGVAELLGGEVDALDECAGIDPLRALVPSLDAWRVIEHLAHEGHLPRPVLYFAAGPVELAS